MTKFHLPSFNSPANSDAFRDGWERTFGKKNDDEKICELCGDETAMFYLKINDVYLDLCTECAGESEDDKADDNR